MAAISTQSAAPIPGLDGSLKSSNGPVAADPLALITRFASQLESTLSSGNFDAEGYWKDQIGLHWNFKTVQGHDKLSAFLNDNSDRARSLFKLEVEKGSATMTGGIGDDKLVLAFFRFETDVGVGRDVFRLRQDKQEE